MPSDALSPWKNYHHLPKDKLAN